MMGELDMKWYIIIALSLIIHHQAQAAQARGPQAIEQRLVKINRALNEKLWDAIEKHDFQQVKQLLDGTPAAWWELWKGNVLEIPDINAYHRVGRISALMHAINYNNIDAIKLLIEAGANLNATDNMGRTPLMIAVEFNNQDAVQILIESGANLNMQNLWGTTALNFAARKGHALIFQKLLYAGADIHKKDADGRTALDYVYEGGRYAPEHVIQGKFEIQKILEQYKKDVAQKVEAHLPPVLSQIVSEYVCE